MEISERNNAINEITRLKSRFLRAIDSGDRTLLGSVLAQDVEIDFRTAAIDPITGTSFASDATQSLIKGRSQALARIGGSLNGVVAVHHVSAPDIEIISSDRASAIWPMTDHLLFPAGSAVSEMAGYGYYHETYSREEGEWKIYSLRLTRTRLAILTDKSVDGEVS